jgi:putative ABC transport system substrate-binding protein
MLSGTEVSSILDFALTHRLPTAFENMQSVADGGFPSYGPDRMENARLAAGYVAKILQRTAPADLPVQRPTRFHLAVNLKTAKAIRLTIPPAILDLADEVIE